MRHALSFFLLGLLSLCVALPVRAQDEEYYTKEFGGALGLTSLMSDANSSAFGAPNVGAGAVLRFILNPRMAVKTMLTYNQISGNVSGIKNFYPQHLDQASTDRLNYQFSGAMYDLSALYELHFLPYGYHRSYLGNRRLVPFLQLGFGLTYSQVGKAFTANIPFGVGVKYKLRPRLNLALDWKYHFTPSDRLEGLEAPLGIRSDFFRNKDHYGQMMITLTYDFSPRCPACNKAD